MINLNRKALKKKNQIFTILAQKKVLWNRREEISTSLSGAQREGWGRERLFSRIEGGRRSFLAVVVSDQSVEAVDHHLPISRHHSPKC